MNSDRYPRVALNGIVDGHRNRDWPRKRWIDIIKEDFTERGLDIVEAQEQRPIERTGNRYGNSLSMQRQRYDDKKKEAEDSISTTAMKLIQFL